MRVLLVEDDRLLGQLLADMVDGMGHEVVGPVHRHDEAVRQARACQVDAAVLDLMVGGATTLDVADVLASRGIPFVFSTGFAPAATARPCVMVLSKPYRDDDLRLALDRCRSDMVP